MAGRPDFDNMSKEELVKLAKKTRNKLIGAEDAGDCVMDLCEMYDVDPRADADNERSD